MNLLPIVEVQRDSWDNLLSEWGGEKQNQDISIFEIALIQNFPATRFNSAGRTYWAGKEAREIWN